MFYDKKAYFVVSMETFIAYFHNKIGLEIIDLRSFELSIIDKKKRVSVYNLAIRRHAFVKTTTLTGNIPAELKRNTTFKQMYGRPAEMQYGTLILC